MLWPRSNGVIRPLEQSAAAWLHVGRVSLSGSQHSSAPPWSLCQFIFFGITSAILHRACSSHNWAFFLPNLSVLWIWLEGVLLNRGYCHVWDTQYLVSWAYCWRHHQGPVDTASSSMTSTETDSLQLSFTPKGKELTVPLGPQDLHFSNKNIEISQK